MPWTARASAGAPARRESAARTGSAAPGADRRNRATRTRPPSATATPASNARATPGADAGAIGGGGGGAAASGPAGPDAATVAVEEPLGPLMGSLTRDGVS